MPAAIRSTSVGVSSSTNVTVNRPSGLVDGDLMIAIPWSDDSLVHPAAPAGWTQVGTTQSQSGIGVGKVWQQVASGEPTSESWTVAGGNSASIVWVLAIMGFDTTTPIDAAPVWAQNATASTTRTASAVSPAGADSLLIVSFFSLANNQGADAYTQPTGMTELGDTGDAVNPYVSSALDYQQLSASGTTGTRVSTATRSAKWLAVSLAIKSAAASGALALPPQRRARPNYRR
jgi:hypothetical protein